MGGGEEGRGAACRGIPLDNPLNATLLCFTATEGMSQMIKVSKILCQNVIYSEGVM